MKSKAGRDAKKGERDCRRKETKRAMCVCSSETPVSHSVHAHGIDTLKDSLPAEIGKSHVDHNLKSALDLAKNRKTLNESLVSQLADMDRELLILKNSTICKGHGYIVKFCHRCLEDCLTEKDKELSKEAIKLKGIMQKSDMFRSDMVEENIRLKSERSELIKAVIESGSFQIKDLPYFNRLWAGAENGKLMPEATRKLYELEIIEKEKVLELIKGDKI